MEDVTISARPPRAEGKRKRRRKRGRGEACGSPRRSAAIFFEFEGEGRSRHREGSSWREASSARGRTRPFSSSEESRGSPRQSGKSLFANPLRLACEGRGGGVVFTSLLRCRRPSGSRSIILGRRFFWAFFSFSFFFFFIYFRRSVPFRSVRGTQRAKERRAASLLPHRRDRKAAKAARTTSKWSGKSK